MMRICIEMHNSKCIVLSGTDVAQSSVGGCLARAYFAAHDGLYIHP